MAGAIVPGEVADGRAMPLNVVVLGPPGAGKGTQAERLAADAAIPKISTGDILRMAVAAGTPVGRSAQAIMDAGHLVGDEIMVELVRERLVQPDTAAGFVLDGFPRTVAQAEALDRLTAGRGPLVVIHVVVPADELVRRLSSRRVCGSCGANMPAGVEAGAACQKCGGAFGQRPDDAEEVVRERLQVFVRQTEPLVEYYSSGPAFYEVDGNQALEVVTAAMRDAVTHGAAVGNAGQGR